MKKLYDNFTNLYPVSKTLRFELKPIGKTLKNLRENKILVKDEQRAEDYKAVKKFIDKYHKKFINESLINFEIDKDDIKKYYEFMSAKNKNEKDFKDLKLNLRKSISNRFTSNPNYNKLFSKEMINECLPIYIENKTDVDIINKFSKFTTYFRGFNENRENMYGYEEKSGSIAYRLIDENMPIFNQNIKSFEYIKEVFSSSELDKIYNDLKEIMQVGKLEDMFKFEYFNYTLTQIGIDIYNQIIGGISQEDGKKIKGINEYINEYKQIHKEDKKIAKLDALKKQILSDRETESFVIDEFKEDQEVIDAIREISLEIDKKEIKTNLKQILNNIKSYDLEKIYLRNDLSLTDISNYLYEDWSIITQSIKNWYDEKYGVSGKIATTKHEESRKKYLKNQKNFSIQFLNECIKNNEKFIGLENYFIDYKLTRLKEDNSEEKLDIFDSVNKFYKNVEKFLNSTYPNEKNLKEDYVNITLIKDYLDSLKSLQSLIKPLLGARFDLELEKDNQFYDEINKYWDELKIITPLYDKVRNYLTGKVYSTDKIKLNFENSTLLNGWDVNKENENRSIILKKDNLYYLGIFDKDYKWLLERNNDEKNYYEKIEYKLLPGPNKMLPKVFFASSNIEKYNPSKQLLENYKNGLHTKGQNFNLKFCHELIDFFKESIYNHPDWKNFNFNFSDTKNYDDISDFYKEVEQQGYKITYTKISCDYLEKLVDEGKLYLFKIYNKDFSENSTRIKRTPNLHTLYWKMLFSEDNLKDVVYKLNGEAEIFYRKASIDRKTTHPKNEKIENKNKNNSKKESIFAYDLIKNKRFTEEKFLFHVPITLNFKSHGINNINEKVNKQIKITEENFIIGIDRGERNLLYLVLINSKGNIEKEISLNEIANDYNNINYHDLLDKKEKDRKKSRESWQSINSIKELKEGYLSQVIAKITDLMIEYNAIVVLEDLNFGFMRGRQKFEKQVYQKFEKALIDKLNYLVKKDKLSNENGGLLKAYQLTNKFESFKKLGKQSGVLFYIPAWNTSKMDPVTGFVNLFYNLKYENIEKVKNFINNIDDIKYNKNNDSFEFYIDYSKFTDKAKNSKQNWTICTYGNRVETFRNKEKNNQWDSKVILLTEEYKNLFSKYKIDFLHSTNLKEDILKISEKDFFETFINLYKLTLQMRNSMSGENINIDYIISPVADENGNFFNSNSGNSELPKDADANGAYNIARKGLWVVNQIKNTPDDKLSKIKLAISNEEWLNFIQKKEWNK